MIELPPPGNAEMQHNAATSNVESSNDSKCWEKKHTDAIEVSGIGIAVAMESCEETEVEELITCDKDVGIDETHTNDTGYSSLLEHLLDKAAR